MTTKGVQTLRGKERTGSDSAPHTCKVAGHRRYHPQGKKKKRIIIVREPVSELRQRRIPFQVRGGACDGCEGRHGRDSQPASLQAARPASRQRASHNGHKIVTSGVTWQPCWNVLVSHIVVAEVVVSDVGRRLIVAGDTGRVRDSVLLRQHSEGHQRDEVQRLPPLMPHEAHCALVDDAPQDHEVVILALLLAHKVALQVGLHLALLLTNVREVNEEAGAHVALQGLELLLAGRTEVPHQQIAVFQQAAAADLLGPLGGDEFVPQVAQRQAEVPVHTLPTHCGVEGLRHGRLCQLVVGEHGVQHDLKGVHTELKLPAYRVHKLQLHIAPVVVGEGDQTPAVLLCVDFHQLLHPTSCTSTWLAVEPLSRTSFTRMPLSSRRERTRATMSFSRTSRVGKFPRPWTGTTSVRTSFSRLTWSQV
ncbi:hypothetical protein F7725_002341 [Dissostichus mawsoni]|uniref:Uncharacterized protein n=1 Tax=Dissostichus mawsoni TaxID=36200 RepID=A0A7J5Y233_DISMA|nr:hypothetical protein F7725_002341 [Dissostichus mawsoni]